MTNTQASSVASDGNPAPPATPTRPATPGTSRRRGRLSLAWQGVLALLALFSLIFMGIALVMNTYGRRQVVVEAEARVELAGNRAVEQIRRRVDEITALSRTLAQSVRTLPKEVDTFSRVLPELIDFQGEPAVAGGGYWPEPGAFTVGLERRSFFWGRGEPGPLRYFDDYNAPAPHPGYHRAEWYVPARHLGRGQVYWSRSYQDPYSLQPMVTCTAGVEQDGQFEAAVTIDLKLEGLGALLQTEPGEGGGYRFLLDRNNRFISFPRLEARERQRSGEAGKAGLEHSSTAELAARQPEFQPIASAVEQMNAEIRRLARATPGFDTGLAAALDQASDEIAAAEAEQIAAVMLDPLSQHPPRKGSHLFTEVQLPRDFLTGEPAVASVFHLPATYWKLVQVSPRKQLEQAAGRVTQSLLWLISGILATVLLPAYLLVSRQWITPVTTLAKAANLVRDGELDVRVSMPGQNEIAGLADSFNEMVGQLAENTAGLKRANVDLQRTLTLTDTIMGVVREGLFLLRADLAIEPKYSAAARQIFGQEELSGASFLDLIHRITPDRTHELTARFLRLLFNPAKNDSVIAKVNPLKEVEASFPSKSGQLEQKYLTFTFDRIREGGEIRYAMVTVSDVTARVLLAQQLRQSQQRMERQAELLLSVMHVEPKLLRDFIEDAHTELENINSLLREGRSAALSIPERHTFYRHLAEDIFKGVHSIKGTAAMLRIDYFAAAAHRFEEKLATLRGRAILDGGDFVPIVLELSEMVDGLAEIRDVLARFAEAQKSLSTPAAETDTQLLSSLVARFVEDLAEKSGKKVEVSFRAPGDIVIPFKYKSALRNVMAQLVRNAVAHGIESPVERLAAGKPELGHILFAIRRNNGNLELLFRDDGRGIDYNEVVARVQEMAKSEPAILEPLIDREQKRWRPAELDQMIFHPGFSTADQANQEAGRGFGMSAVKDSLAKLGGRITLRQKAGQFCEFHIVLPNEG